MVASLLVMLEQKLLPQVSLAARHIASEAARLTTLVIMRCAPTCIAFGFCLIGLCASGIPWLQRLAITKTAGYTSATRAKTESQSFYLQRWRQERLR